MGADEEIIKMAQTESDILYQDEVRGSLLSQEDRIVDLIYTKYLKGIISYQNIFERALR